MSIVNETLNRLSAIEYYLNTLQDSQYRRPLKILSGASVGEHTRHIIEFYLCLWTQYHSGIINYDQRKREMLLQQNVERAKAVIKIVKRRIRLTLPGDRILYLNHQTADGTTHQVPTSFERELIYNLEHLIHHLALIKIGLGILKPNLVLPGDFGVAASTIKFKNKSLVSS